VLVDCHAHLADPVFDADRRAVIDRARAAGVGAIVIVGETLDDGLRNLALADEHPELRPAAGLHPTVLDAEQGERLESLIRERRDGLVAVGEVGLDHWKVQDEAGRALQREIFTRFVRLAAELELPLNVHSRSAGRATVELLLREGARRVQLHAFDGRAASAMPAVEAGYFFSIPASIVRSAQKQKLVRRLPLSCLLVESDAPALSPEPGTRNEPARVALALDEIARIKELPRQAVVEQVERNGRRLYG